MLLDLNKTIDLVLQFQTSYVTPVLLIIFRCLVRTHPMTIVFMIKICIKKTYDQTFYFLFFFLT